MAVLRKLINIGNSKAIIIPKEYIEFYEQQGKIFNTVGMQINDKIILEPIFENIVRGD